MELAKILPDGTVDLRHCTSKECEKYKELKQKEFLEFISETPPQITLEQIATNSFDIIKERIVQKWNIKANNQYINNQVENLKHKLEESDYQIIKCYEASLLGEKLPYDIKELHAVRQQIRDEINILQKKISNA